MGTLRNLHLNYKQEGVEPLYSYMYTTCWSAATRNRYACRARHTHACPSVGTCQDLNPRTARLY